MRIVHGLVSTSLKNEPKGMRKFPCLVSTSLKNETRNMRIAPCLVSTSLKNETKNMRIVPCLLSTSLKNETKDMRIVLLLRKPRQKMKQVLSRVHFLVLSSLKNETRSPGAKFQVESLIRSRKMPVESFT